ncbi:MAG: hypothetical protein J3Q66DRAFT_286624 [Benniella sp.]|nr:MAG: hypothetical protein J3Q66DRAFT_286624 [Benniella sp.]
MAGRLSAAEIEQMVADAERLKDEDHLKEKIAKSKQGFEAYIHEMEGTLKQTDVMTKMTLGDRKIAEVALEEALLPFSRS